MKKHVQNLLKLHDATPAPVVWFLAGCLPLEAQLHLRMMSLFGMISRLNEGKNVLADHAREMFIRAKPSSKSWFLDIQKICLKYNLPHPIFYLDSPPSKLTFKKQVKCAVINYWEQHLRGEAKVASSIKFFHPEFMSLSVTHRIFTSCGSSPYEVSKAVIQARCLSGRARIEALEKHWDPRNKDGLCMLCRAEDLNSTSVGSLEHFLLNGGCPSLAEARLSMLQMINAFLVPRPYLFPVFLNLWGYDSDIMLQLLLDCSAIPMVIKLAQEMANLKIYDELFYITRTYVAKILLTRRQLLPIKSVSKYCRT